MSTALPWYFWLGWSIVGVIYILRWLLKNAENEPLAMKIGWWCSILMLVELGVDNIIRGTGMWRNYQNIIDQTANPIVLSVVSLILLGSYQKSKRPDFDPARKRMMLLYFRALIGLAICAGIIWSGFYIYDHFLK